MWTFRCHLVVGLLVSLFIGCETKTESEVVAADPLAGVTLQIGLPETPDVVSAWQQSADEWQERTGATAELTAGTAAGLQVVRMIDVPDLFAAGTLGTVSQDLIDEAGNGLWSDIPRGLRESVCGRRREQGGLIPLSCPVLVCYFRADLLEAADKKPPRTWSDYHDLARSVSDWAPGLSVVEPWSEEFRATMFLARAVSYARYPGNLSLCFDLYSGKSYIADDGFVRALEETQAAIATMPNNVLKMSPIDCSEQVRTGKAALAIGYESLEGSVTRDNSAVIGFAMLPGRKIVYDRTVGEWKTTPDKTVNRPTLTAFTGYCAAFAVGMNEKQQRAASNFVATMTDSDEFHASALPGELRSLCRMSHASLSEQWYSQQLMGDEAHNYSQTVLNALDSTELVAELPIMGREKFRRQLTMAISRVLDQSLSAEESLKQLKREWESLIAELGERAVHNSYRSGFGLSAK